MRVGERRAVRVEERRAGRDRGDDGRRMGVGVTVKETVGVIVIVLSGPTDRVMSRSTATGSQAPLLLNTMMDHWPEVS